MPSTDRKSSSRKRQQKKSIPNDTLSKNSPRTPWTEGRKRSFITSALRGAFRRYPAKFEALALAGVGSKPNKKTGRWAKHYRCAACGGEFIGTDVNVDHVVPVVDVEQGFISWDVFIDRLFCDTQNLQVLCEPCHNLKSAEERSARCKKTPETPKKTSQKRSKGLKNSSKNTDQEK